MNADLLPQLLISRVDVVTGGASAVYGSDALVGVVNFILDKQFTGLKTVAQAGISNYGDGASYRVGAAAGRSFLDGRLHVEASAEYYHTDGLPRNDARALYPGFDPYCLSGTGTQANPFRGPLTACRGTGSNGGNTTGGGAAITGRVFQPDGTLAPYVTGGAGGVGGSGRAGLPQTTLLPEFTTMQTFGRADLELGSSLSMFVQGSYSQTRQNTPAINVSSMAAGSVGGITIFADNAFLNPAVRTALGANPSFQLSRSGNIELAATLGRTDIPNISSYQRSENVQFAAGLSGRITDKWRWDLTGSYGVSNAYDKTRQIELLKAVAAADAVRDNSGNIVCRITITNPGRFPGCVPINLFGVGAPSEAAANYILGDGVFEAKSKLTSVNANVQGSLFDLPAGSVDISVGAEYRHQTLNVTSNSDPNTVLDLSGLRGADPRLARQRYTFINRAAASGDVNVKEAYGEVVVPILKDVTAIKYLEFNGAFRYTNYSTSGNVNTWKLSGSYIPVDGVRFRATLSQDIRAPGLYDLFSGPGPTQFGLTDPHTNTTTTVTLLTTGNPALKPERGRTKALGVVFQPRFLPGFGLSVDAYEITVRDSITTLTSQQILLACEASNGSAAECGLITRPLPFSDRSPANTATQIQIVPFNVAFARQRGIDFEANYSRRLSSLGARLELRAYASYVPYGRIQNATTEPVRNTAGYFLNPKLSGSASVGLKSDNFDLIVTERFTGKFLRPTFEGESFYADNGVAPNVAYTNVTLQMRPSGNKNLEFFTTVQNLFNRQAPLLATNVRFEWEYPTIKAAYDIFGRSYTFGVRTTF